MIKECETTELRSLGAADNPLTAGVAPKFAHKAGWAQDHGVCGAPAFLSLASRVTITKATRPVGWNNTNRSHLEQRSPCPCALDSGPQPVTT